MLLPGFRYVVILCFDRGFSEKRTTPRDDGFTVPVCHKAVIADLHKPIGQNVQEKPSDELLCFDGHGLHVVVIGLVSPEERDLAVRNPEDAVVADGDSVGIPAEIL